MIAAENGALPGGKIGGMGDVLRDLPNALAELGHRVTVLTPSYGMFARLPGATLSEIVSVPFAGSVERARRFDIPSSAENVGYQLLDHPFLSPRGEERVYHDDDPASPFETDAAKFAFFCAGAAAVVGRLSPAPDVVHLHDWHLGLYFLLRAYDGRFASLKPVRTVFSIHNLALQGTRPLRGSDSSLESWFPDIDVPRDVIVDPKYPDCVNPMAIAIRLADAVNTVSPSYAKEILLPPDERTGRRGGESLDALLRARSDDGVLSGILNGCTYPKRPDKPLKWKQLVDLLRNEVLSSIAGGSLVDASAYLAMRRIEELPAKRPAVIATSVGRATEQKVGLFFQGDARSAMTIDRVLAALGDGMLIMLGSGEARFEALLQQASVRCPNLLFFKGYSEPLARALYASGDLFLMPSLFEPCGISQMLAMRAGQACVVHAVGGLKDTVSAENGFPFAGATRSQQARNFVRTVSTAVELKLNDPVRWSRISHSAAGERFTWKSSAEKYVREVYRFDAA